MNSKRHGSRNKHKTDQEIIDIREEQFQDSVLDSDFDDSEEEGETKKRKPFLWVIPLIAIVVAIALYFANQPAHETATEQTQQNATTSAMVSHDSPATNSDHTESIMPEADKQVSKSESQIHQLETDADEGTEPVVDSKAGDLTSSTEEHAVNNPTEVNPTISTSPAVNTQELDSLNQKLEEQSQEIDRLKQGLAQANQATLAFNQRLQDLIQQKSNSSPRDIDTNHQILNEVSYLLRMANNEINIGHSASGAIRSLEAARQSLLSSQNAAFEALGASIASDIVSLKGASKIDITSLYQQTQALVNLAATAPLVTPDQQGEPLSTDKAVSQANPTIIPISPDDPWYRRVWLSTQNWAQRTWSWMTSDMSGLVRVEKLSKPNALLLSVNQASALRNQLVMNIRVAQQALLSGQEGIWKDSLSLVLKNLEAFYASQDVKVKQAENLVEQLLDSPIQASLPTIKRSLDAFKNTQSLLESKGE